MACVGLLDLTIVCVCQRAHHPKSSAGKGTVHSSCVQVSCPDLFIYIHLHAVKQSRRWQPPEPTVFLDPGPILSAWIHSTVKGGTGKVRGQFDQPQRKKKTCRDCVSMGKRQAEPVDLQTSLNGEKLYMVACQIVCSNIWTPAPARLTIRGVIFVNFADKSSSYSSFRQ